MKFGVIFIIATFLLVYLFFGKTLSCQRLSCISMNGLNNFKIKEIYKEDDGTFRALYTNKEKMLKVETITQPSQFIADQYISAGIAQIKGLFTDSLAPYPGIASNTIACAKEYQPSYFNTVTINKLSITYFIAYLNSNLTYGSCTESQAVNKGISVYFYCSKDKRAYHFEIIAPRKIFESSMEDYQKSIRSIKCN